MASLSTRIPRRRWMIGGLLGAGVLINYIDRINLSVAAPQLKAEFHLTTADMGLLFSAFFWSYALLQIPAGLILDRFGVTRIGRWGAFLWALASGAVALTSGFGGIFVARMLLGVAEAPGFPANSKATGYWFPRKERSVATSLFDAAAKFSNVIGVPLVAFVTVGFGWRWGFGITAILSLAYFLAFYWLYRDPSADKKLAPEEHAYIIQGGATPEGEFAAGAGSMLAYLLKQRKVWGLSLGFAAYGYSFYLFLTWLPGYLVQTMHMSIIKSAGFAAIPWACATVSDILFGGLLVDRLVSAGWDETKVRKAVLVIGMLFGLAVFGATRTTDPHWAIFWISIALPVWRLGPHRLVNPLADRTQRRHRHDRRHHELLNNMMGVIAPIATGFIVGATDNFETAFLVAGIVLLVGIFFYVVVLGRIEPIPSPE